MAEPVPPSGRKSPATPAVIETKPAKGVWTADQLNQLELRDGEPSRRSFAAKMFHVTPWGWIKVEGALTWRLKDHIDRKFMRQYATPSSTAS